MTDPIAPQAHQAIYRRWRAQTFAQVVGQEAVVETLRNAVRTNRVAHAILFVGPRGTGKTSLARILAKAVNCTNLQDGDPCDACPSCVSIREGRAMDLVEIDAASNRGIDAIRDLRERINYAPTDLRRKVYILDEAHQITKDAWNALLKSLEEPPEFVVFMFASTHPQEFPPAIMSRLQRFDVRRLTTDEIEGKLRRILDADGRTASPEAVHLIARLAAGGMRDAESMLDQLLSSSTDELDEARVRDLLGLADTETIDGFVDALVANDALAGIRLLDRARGPRPRPPRLPRPGHRGAPGRDRRQRPEGRAHEPPGHPSRDGPRRQRPDASRPSTRVEPASAASGCSSSSRSSPTRGRLAFAPGSRAAASPARRREPAPAPSPAPSRVPAVDSESPRRRPRRRRRSGPVARGRAQSRSAADSPAEPRPHRRRHAATTAEPATPEAVGAAKPRRRRRPRRTRHPRAAIAGTPAATGDLGVLRDRWPEIVARISAHPPTKPLIVVCRPISVEGNVVTLGFPEDKAFLRAGRGAPDGRPRGEHLGRPRSDGGGSLRRDQHRRRAGPPDRRGGGVDPRGGATDLRRGGRRPGGGRLIAGRRSCSARPHRAD